MIDLRLDRAIRMACQAHRHQVRKGSGVPYISHPVAVAMMLQRHGFPEDWVIAGLLHDTLEDTSLPLARIRREFGDEVARIVEGCSEPDHHTRPWEERKQHTIEYMKTAPLAVKVVTCADKLHNLHSILQDRETQGDAVWARFKKPREKQAWYYRNLLQSLLENLDPENHYPIFDELAEAVEAVFGRQQNK